MSGDELFNKVREIADGKIECACGNARWKDFLYIGVMPDFVAACKRCGSIYAFNGELGAWKLSVPGPNLVAQQTPYEPSPTDVEWARKMITMITQGGVLHFPSTDLIYQMDHEHKELILQNPWQLMDLSAFVVHLRTISTFGAIGYKVKERHD